MPVRYTPFVKDFIYHIYNRGVDGREIFIDDDDYANFLRIAKHFINMNAKKRPGLPKVDIIAYCLMPNHYHLLLKEGSGGTMSNYMLRLMTTYAMFFNRKYERSGTLFEGRFKSRLIGSNESLLQVSRYIHLNPLDLSASIKYVNDYRWSTYRIYLGLEQDRSIRKNELLALEPNYKEFVESKALDEFSQLKDEYSRIKRKDKPLY